MFIVSRSLSLVESVVSAVISRGQNFIPARTQCRFFKSGSLEDKQSAGCLLCCPSFPFHLFFAAWYDMRVVFLEGDKCFCCDRVDLLYAHVDSLVLFLLDLWNLKCQVILYGIYLFADCGGQPLHLAKIISWIITFHLRFWRLV